MTVDGLDTKNNLQIVETHIESNDIDNDVWEVKMQAMKFRRNLKILANELDAKKAEVENNQLNIAKLNKLNCQLREKTKHDKNIENEKITRLELENEELRRNNIDLASQAEKHLQEAKLREETINILREELNKSWENFASEKIIENCLSEEKYKPQEQPFSEECFTEILKRINVINKKTNELKNESENISLTLKNREDNAYHMKEQIEKTKFQMQQWREKIATVQEQIAMKELENIELRLVNGKKKSFGKSDIHVTSFLN